MPRSTTRVAACALAVATALQTLTPAVAFAHTGLRRAVPARGARLTIAPRALRLTFTEAIEPALARVTLLAPDGSTIALSALGGVRDSAQVITADVQGALTATGAYTVRWQVAGRDGHPVRGSYAFTVLPGATGLAVVADSAAVAAPAAVPTAPAAERALPSAPPSAPVATRAFDAQSPLYVVVRWLGYLAMLVAIGAAAFRLLVVGALRRGRTADALLPLASRRAATLGFWAAVALLVAALARLAAQSTATLGGAGASGLTTTVARTLWGRAWLLQVGAALVALAGYAVARRRPDAPGAWALATGAAVTLALSAALSGHAVAAPRLAPLAVVADTLHVLAAAGWLGTLLVLVAAGLPAARVTTDGRRGAHAAALAHAFSPAALACAGLAALTGLFATWLHVGRLPALWEGTYGRLLLLKLALLALAALAGAYNWRRVRPALGDDAGTARLQRVAGAELAAGVLVLLATAALVATPTPAESPAADARRASMSSTVAH
jgi:putative copper export protein/methionine-rich copper-binding protein CopC